MMGVLTPAEHYHLIKVMLGKRSGLRVANSTLVRMVVTLDIPIDFDGSLTTPTAPNKRIPMSASLAKYWITLVDLPAAEDDFANFVKTKIQSWEPEEMIEACTIIAQDTENLTREYLALIKHREDCGRV